MYMNIVNTKNMDEPFTFRYKKSIKILLLENYAISKTKQNSIFKVCFMCYI